MTNGRPPWRVGLFCAEAALHRAAHVSESACQCVADVIKCSGEADRLSTLDETRKAELKRYVDACKAP